MERGPKIVQGETEAMIKQKAAVIFDAAESDLSVHFVKPKSGDMLQAVVYPAADMRKYENMDGTFNLYFEKDGTYFEMIPASGSGKTLDRRRLEQYLERKKLKDIQWELVDQILDHGVGFEKIAAVQTGIQLNEDLEIIISQDEMTAYAALLPAEQGGLPMTRERAQAQIAEQGVTYGIDETILENVMLEKQFYRRFAIARGTSAQDGENGRLIFHFKRDHFGMQMLLDEKDKVDYKNLDLYAKVNAGDLLVSKLPATEGQTGYTVKGKALKAKSGKESKLPRGDKVTYNQAKSEMYAAVSGRVDYVGDRISVSNVLTIDGDVDFSVGNIDFNGDVIVKGNVISGFKVKATGRVEVKGNVQRAQVIAGGDVVVVNGVQGLDSGYVETGGTLSTKFLERSRVKAKVSVIADQIIHSHVECGGEVVAKGEHGAIIGGTIKATVRVIAKVMGTEEQVKTNVEVGINPALRNELSEAERQLAEVLKQLEEREKITNYLKAQPQLTPERQELMRKTILSKLELTQEQERLTKKCEELSSMTESANDGKVHVTKVIYPGVILIISMVPYRIIGSPIQSATFQKQKGEVIFGPCETNV